MKQVNDRDGHAAGDHVLLTLVWRVRARLRPFDPIVRYGGDEFVAGLGGACMEEAEERFDLVCTEMCDELGVGITVGLAELEPDETLQQLTNRADASLAEAKARRVAKRCASSNLWGVSSPSGFEDRGAPAAGGTTPLVGNEPAISFQH
jgi:diguanylate cyclase (GGDEF)-like protein